MKRLALILISALVLTACSDSEEVKQERPSVPLFCDQTKVLDAFPDKVPNPKFIQTDWEPAEGTDLFAAYNAGGIACSYGIEEAEIGATVLWAPDYGITFSGLEEGWKADGLKEIDLPDFDEDKAYVLTEGIEGEGEYHVWKVNALVDGFWIQVGATFFGSIDEAMPLVKAAADSILTTEEALAQNVKGCYVANANGDIFVLDITYHDNATVTANMGFKPYQKDSSKGLFVGTYENGILHGIYTFESEGMESERELYFKEDEGSFLPGNGPVEVIDNKLERFQRPLSLKWDTEYRYAPGEECINLIKGI